MIQRGGYQIQSFPSASLAIVIVTAEKPQCEGGVFGIIAAA